MEEEQGRNLEAETEAQTVGEGCLLPVSSSLLSLLSFTPQDHMPRVGTIHIELDSPT